MSGGFAGNLATAVATAVISVATPADDESRDDRASEAAIDRSCRGPPALLSKEAAGRSIHRTGVPARTDRKTSRIAWVDAFASTPEMSESCVAVGMTR